MKKSKRNSPSGIGYCLKENESPDERDICRLEANRGIWNKNPNDNPFCYNSMFSPIETGKI